MGQATIEIGAEASGKEVSMNCNVDERVRYCGQRMPGSCLVIALTLSLLQLQLAFVRSRDSGTTDFHSLGQTVHAPAVP